MKTVLYYFSATGNSLAVAREIRDRLGDCRLVSIPKAMADQEEARRDGTEVVGILAPIYMHNMPHMVSRFLERIEQPEYLFMVYTGGGDLGAGLGRTRKRFSRLGLHLSALFNVPMPSNYTPYGYPDEQEQQRRFQASEQRVGEIAETIRKRGSHFDSSNSSFFERYLHPGPLYQLGYRFIPKMDGGFSVDDRCTSCGICERLCPSGNISLLDGRPAWAHRCEQCYGCLQWCPVHAIEYGDKTRGVPRYHHPKVRLQDIEAGAPGT